jgi:methylenetetrahydrofolate dehydrogenase (NADP+)/methenyltetrahydrofolate cyclohydrolase
MVASLSLGRSRYAEHADLLAAWAERGRALASRLLELADEDAEAYAGFAAALKMPRETEEERAARTEALHGAARKSAEAPLRCVEACREVVEGAEALAGRSNVNAASDLAVAALLTEAASRGAAANVLVNLPATGDEVLAADLSVRVDDLLRDVERLAPRGPRGRPSGDRAAPDPRHGSMTLVASPPVLDGIADEGSPRLLRGAPIAAEIRSDVAGRVAAFRHRYGYAPTLAVVLVGRDAPSAVYLHQILKSCAKVGIEGRLVEIPGRVSAAAVRERLEVLNADPQVSGIIVQMPLPPAIRLTVVTDTIDPVKDDDGIHPENAGRLVDGYQGFLPTTAQAAVELLKRSGIEIEGRRAVVVGRSNVVGKPVALLLLREHATVTICHSRTRDLGSLVREGDIVVVAAGRPGLVTGDMLRPGAVVVDIGINVVGDGLVGDVDFASASRVVSAITPVPGGVHCKLPADHRRTLAHSK